MRINLVVSQRVSLKLLRKHNVSIGEVEECFANRTMSTLIDNRPWNKTEPPTQPTQWFIAPTDSGRRLLVAFMFYRDKSRIQLKTAYEPNMAEERLYEEKAST